MLTFFPLRNRTYRSYVNRALAHHATEVVINLRYEIISVIKDSKFFKINNEGFLFFSDEFYAGSH